MTVQLHGVQDTNDVGTYFRDVRDVAARAVTRGGATFIALGVAAPREKLKTSYLL